MTSHVLPIRGAELGRAIGAKTGSAVRAAVLVLPAGNAVSIRRPSPMAATAALPLARHLARAGRAEGLVAHIARYRFHGRYAAHWTGVGGSGGHTHPAADATWAANEIVRRYGDIPICLAGADFGARAALRTAGHPAVHSVVALAPWFPPSQEGQEPEAVNHLAGRHVLIAHGTNDSACDPHLSYRFAQRAKNVSRDVCRFEVHTDGHSLRHYRPEVFALTADFILGTLCDRPFARPVMDALAAPPPLGLRMPLAVGFRG